MTAPADDRPEGPPPGTHEAEEFLTAFNRIERELKRRTGVADHEGFKTAAHRFADRHRWWRGDLEAMLAFSDLRNVIVHDRYERFAYLSIPSQDVLNEIRAIHDRLVTPVRADEAFRRDVVAVDVSDRLADVLATIRDRSITQFPVYDAGAFEGLLTAAGIVRWLAATFDAPSEPPRDPSDGPLGAIAGRTVADVLAVQKDRRDWIFVARDVPALEVVEAFVDAPRLEAVLITEHGRHDQGLLGIATTSDAAAWRDELP
ncbi:MAG: CBS domain-containing protein [Trueperaceae bacterium]|nr:CBS domain-containing protein [Trueperaceae bacterium]